MGSYFSSQDQVSQPAGGTTSTPTPRTLEPPKPAAPRDTERCYDPLDQTLTFIDGEDVLDFEYVGYRSQRAAMSCGHAVTPMSLNKYCRWLLKEGRHRFVCPVDGCEAEWNFAEVCKMGLLTQEEKEDFKEKASSYFTQEFVVTKSCPGCKSPLLREDASNLRVHCRACSDKNMSSDFCWQCLREWRGPSPRSDRCDNHGCVNEDLEVLENCKEIYLIAVMDTIVCPSVRACPTCGLLLVHNTQGCKFLRCTRCKVIFCFVCLKPDGKCIDCYDFCVTAPRQESIAVWHKN